MWLSTKTTSLEVDFIFRKNITYIKFFSLAICNQPFTRLSKNFVKRMKESAAPDYKYFFKVSELLTLTHIDAIDFALQYNKHHAIRIIIAIHSQNVYAKVFKCYKIMKVAII